jgi:hypothetical protein
MGQFNLSMQGRNVKLALVANPIGSTSVAIGIFDANQNVDVLLPTERLVIDFLEGNLTAGSADVLGAPAPTSTSFSSTLIASFNTAEGLEIDTKEGIACPVGVIPCVLATISTAVVKIAGAGRIMEGTTQGVRPAYQCLQTPNGNF